MCLLLFTASIPQKATWKGSIEKKNGVTVVNNPKKPIYANEVIAFEEELIIGKSDGPQEYILNYISSFASFPRSAERIVPPKRIRFSLLSGERIVWGIQSEYEFHICDSTGTTIKRIRKDHPAVRVSEDYKEKYFERLPPTISKKSQNISQHFPAFDQFFTDDEGRLFVKTYVKLKGTDKYIIDVFDPEGRYLCQTALKVGDEISLDQDKYVIKNSKLYSGEIDEEGFPVLKRYKIVWMIEE